jgi:pimeloyl-ACP methyl ester carboxylesterase
MSLWLSILMPMGIEASIGASLPEQPSTPRAPEVWLGDLRTEAKVTTVRIEVTSDVAGEVSLIPFGPAASLLAVSRRPSETLVDLDFGGRTLSIELPSGRDTVQGDLAPGEGAPAVRFELRRLAGGGREESESLEGIYEDASSVLLVSRFGEFGKALFLTDLQSGEVGPLYPTGAGEWLWAGSVVSPVFPERGRVVLSPATGRTSAAPGKRRLQLSRAGAPTRSYRPRPLLRRALRFENEGIALAGTVLAPVRGRARAGIVMLHGSNDEDRDHIGPFALFFAAQGYVVLAYDKRGCGESSGDWKAATFGDLAADAASAVRTLRRQPEVDSRRVGLWAPSQGGWIAPLIARGDATLAFVILHAGAAVTPAEQGLQLVEAELRAYGFEAPEIEKAASLQRLSDEVTRERKPWTEYKARYDEAVAARAEWIIAPAEEEGSWFRRFFRGIMDFDPRPHWAKVRCPVLALFGDRDWIVPADPNATLLPLAFPPKHRSLLTIRVLPNANHLMLHAAKGVLAEYPSCDRFEPAYFDAIHSWLDQHVSSPR